MHYAAFILGFVGSLHCAGMCGPLLVLLPSQVQNKPKYVLGRILYNLGRITSYGFIGLIIGFAGQSLSMAISQKWLSITTGVVILLFLLIPIKSTSTFSKPLTKINSWLKKSFSSVIKRKPLESSLLFGIANGFLPCGLVYAALAGALLQSTALNGAFYMMSFGLGTVPMMLSLSLGMPWIKRVFSFKFQRVVPIIYTLVAFWLIYRGLGFNPQIIISSDLKSITVCH